jgi:hypothetical protein
MKRLIVTYRHTNEVKMPKKTHKQLMKIALARPGVKHEYDALKNEFVLLRELARARFNTGKTQRKMAKKKDTTTDIIF